MSIKPEALLIRRFRQIDNIRSLDLDNDDERDEMKLQAILEYLKEVISQVPELRKRCEDLEAALNGIIGNSFAMMHVSESWIEKTEKLLSQ